jgi:hypothetical protein
MSFYDGTADRQAQSQALRLGREERLEQPWRRFGREPDAVVAHRDLRNVVHGANRKLDLPSSVGRSSNRVDRILHQVHHDLLDLNAVGINR